MTKATRSAKASASSPTASPTPGPCLLPPFLLSLGLLEPFLGFTALMDCRAVCREMARRFEKPALQWLTEIFGEKLQKDLANKRRCYPQFYPAPKWTEEKDGKEGEGSDGSDEKKEDRAMTDPRLAAADGGSAMEAHSASSMAPARQRVQSIRPPVPRSVAVFLRQQLDRWGSHGVQAVDDPLRVLISPSDAAWAFGFHQEVSYRVAKVTTRRSLVALKLIDLVYWATATHQFDGYDAGYPLRFREAEKKRGIETKKADRPLLEQLSAEDAEQARATRRWMRSSTGAPLLLSLPADVLVHSVLVCLDFEPLMDLRSVSRTFQPLVERAAVWWMNRRFPEGLATVQRQQEEQAAKKPKKKAVKATGKRKRSSEEAQTATVPAAASYSAADAVWARQQILLARRFDSNQKDILRHPRRAPPPVYLCKTEVLAEYPLSSAVWEQRFGGTEQKRVSGVFRHTAVDVVGLLFAVYGRASAVQEAQVKRAGTADKRHETERVKTEQRVAAVEAAVSALGLETRWQGKEPGKSFKASRILFGWAALRRWWWSYPSEVAVWDPETRVRRTLRDPEAEEVERKLHRVMRSMGLACAGNCQWGGCPRPW